MQLNYKILQTSTFRLSALYLLLFAISVAALLGYIYLNTTVLLERQTDDTIRAEVQGLADQYRLRGLAGIIETIQRRSREDTGSIYLLADPNNKAVAGNLDTLPNQATTDSEWIEFALDVKHGGLVEQHEARAFHADLTGNYELVVGRDVEPLRQFAGIIRGTVYWALGIALVLGLGGGLLMSRNFLRRVDAITEASRSIMDGNMAGRMPVSGSGDELDRLALALNAMLEQIERLMAGMKEVSSNVAHDLKTPLTRIKANVESALRSGNDEEYREALEKTVEESDRLLQTFNALLSITRAESGQSRSGLEPLDARAILDDVAELYEPMAEELGGGLVVEADGELPVMADRAVGDRGDGISEQDREHVVERFVRLDSSRSRPGNGLGLSLVSGVMKLHGGSLQLGDNHPGLLAKLVLPLHRAAS
ncbi:MAG: HAMP domain-containing protein [Rhizobiales bacterium]|nr:HAMP domain-containing protein [Hyphomicrobiales bacterium]